MHEGRAWPQDGAASAIALSDIVMDGLVNVAHIRAPAPHGRIRAIKPPALPAGYLMVTARDIPGAQFLPGLDSAIPLLASGSFSWKGEPVALIVGPDPNIVAELAALASVEWEELPAILDGSGSPSSSVIAKRSFSRGDVDVACAQATTLLEDTWRSSTLEHWYSEPQGAIAWSAQGRVIVRTATQWPSHVRDCVASVLGSDSGQVRVIPTLLGVHLDGKIWYPSMLACHAALASRAAGKPARVLFTREEDFLYSPKGARVIITLRAALDSAGRLSAIDARITLDIGAGAAFARAMLVEAGTAMIGAWNCPNLRIEAVAVRTNTPPAGAFAGLGAAHAFFAAGALATRLAEEIDQDPISWMSDQVLTRGMSHPSGEALRVDLPIRAIGGRIAAASDFRRRHASYELLRKRGTSAGILRGIGYAFAFQSDGIFASDEPGDNYSMEAVLDKDLKLLISSTCAPPDGGISSLWRSEAARILSLPLEDIIVMPPDTDLAPPSGPGIRSRSISVSGRLVTRVCQAIRKRRFRDPLPIPAKASARVERGLTWTEAGMEGSPFVNAAWAAAVVEVEINSFTGETRPTGLWLCIDGGQILSTEKAAKSLRAASLDALWASAGEEVMFESGAVLHSGYYSYSHGTRKSLVPVAIEFINPDRATPLRGIGELPFHCIPAAFLSAASQALGAPITSLPLHAEPALRARSEP